MALSEDEKNKAPLTPEEAAEYLKVTRRTIDRWIADGTIKASKIGRVVRIKRSEIDRILSGAPA
jgi:excisionase family DNA binding protein